MDQPQSRTLELHGKPFHYLDFGGAGLPPLVLVHGTGLHAWTWLTHGLALKADFHVYAFDLRGHGDSTKAFTNYSWGTMAEDLAAFVARLGLEGAVAVGHSMGGATVVLAQSASPELFSRAVLIEPIIMPPAYYLEAATPDTLPLAARALRRRWVWNSVDEMVRSYSRKLPFSTWKPRELLHYVQYGTEPAPEGGIRLKCPPVIEANAYLGGSLDDPWPHLPNIKIPALVLYGSRSETRAFVPFEKIAQSLFSGNAREIPDATHFVPMDQPEAVVALVLGFHSL